MGLDTTTFLFHLGHGGPDTRLSVDSKDWNPHSSIDDAGNGVNFSEITSNITSFSTDCIIVQYDDFIPWNNPDNIVSFQVEDLMRKAKDLVFLPIMFLIGCPANLINMAVFYKQGLKERINVCLFALSLADELYMISNMVYFGEQLHVHFTTKEMQVFDHSFKYFSLHLFLLFFSICPTFCSLFYMGIASEYFVGMMLCYGPVLEFVSNNYLLGFHGFIWVSQILSAIIASERCFCVLQPLRSQTVLRTSTTVIVIVLVNVVILLFSFILTSRYRAVCAYDPFSKEVLMISAPSEFYFRHEQLIIYLDVFVFGVGVPGLVTLIVMTTTIITMIKLRQAAAWRAGTSSSSGVTQRDLSLTKMLVANSIFFIVCVLPFICFRLVFLFMPEVNTGRRQHNFYLMIQWLLVIISFFNCTFNIVVYYTMGSRYRETFWQLFGIKISDKKKVAVY